MDADTPLWKAHDISQQLQDKIEVLPNVERAFVHVDHETTHTPVSSYYVFTLGFMFMELPSGTPKVCVASFLCLEQYPQGSNIHLGNRQ